MSGRFSTRPAKSGPKRSWLAGPKAAIATLRYDTTVSNRWTQITVLFVMLGVHPAPAVAIENARFAAVTDSSPPMLWRDYAILDAGFTRCVAHGLEGTSSVGTTQAECNQIGKRRTQVMGVAMKQALLINDSLQEGPQFCAPHAAALIAQNRLEEAGGIAIYLVEYLLGGGNGPYGNELQDTYVAKVVFDSLVKAGPCKPARPESNALFSESPSPEIPSWWQVSCEHHHQQTLFSGVDVELRQFPLTSQTLEQRKRVITFWTNGFQYRADGVHWNIPWKDLKKVSVRKINDRNSGLVIAVSTSSSKSPLEIGGIELTCWREVEQVVSCYAPSSIEGSPPKPDWPLHDSDGKVVPDAKAPNPYCPSK